MVLNTPVCFVELKSPSLCHFIVQVPEYTIYLEKANSHMNPTSSNDVSVEMYLDEKASHS